MRSDLTKKRVLVMGLGLNHGGEATASYVARHGSYVTVTDLKKKRELAPTLFRLRKLRGVRYTLGKHDRRDFRNQDLIFRNPAVPNSSPFLQYAKRRGIPITNEAAYFLDRCQGMTIGVTGTRGKSTTTALIFQLLKRGAYARHTYMTGNIATRGMLSVLDRITTNDTVVVELSSFQLEHLPDIRKSPHVALLTSIYADHLNRYRSFDDYVAAKKNIFRYQHKNDLAILPDEDEPLRYFRPIVKSNLYFFSKKRRVRGCYLQKNHIYFAEIGKRPTNIASRSIIPTSQLPYIENVLAAITVAMIQKVPLTHIRKTLRNFRSLPYRMETIATIQKTTVVNDSCSTSPTATERGLQVTPKPLLLIAGGVDKQLSYQTLATSIQKNATGVILLPGSATKKLYAALRAIQYPSVTRANNLAHALHLAKSSIGTVRTILFSPGAASFNLFKNEFDRGRQFTYAVKKLIRARVS